MWGVFGRNHLPLFLSSTHWGSRVWAGQRCRRRKQVPFQPPDKSQICQSSLLNTTSSLWILSRDEWKQKDTSPSHVYPRQERNMGKCGKRHEVAWPWDAQRQEFIWNYEINSALRVCNDTNLGHLIYFSVIHSHLLMGCTFACLMHTQPLPCNLSQHPVILHRSHWGWKEEFSMWKTNPMTFPMWQEPGQAVILTRHSIIERYMVQFLV